METQQALTPNQLADSTPNVNNNFNPRNIAQTPTQIAQNTGQTIPKYDSNGNYVSAPAVVTAKDAITDATNIQQTLQDKTTGAQGIATSKQGVTTTYAPNGDMIITGGINPATGATYSNTIPKGSAGYIPNPADIDKQNQQNQQNLQNQETNTLTSAITGTLPTNLPSSTPVPFGIDVSTSQGQTDFYKQNPQGFEQWATDQGWTDENISNFKYQASVQKYNDDANAAKADLQSFQNGTYPLTPQQQQILEATKAQFESLIKQQQVTNQNYENGVRILGNVTGRAEYFPDIAMGQVQTAINSGLAKVADLNSKEADTLAQMEQGFKENNFKMVTDAYNTVLEIDKQQEDTLKGVHDSIVQAQQTAFENQQKLNEFNWKKVVDSNTMDFNDKKLALDKLQLDETTRHNAQEELISRESALKGTYQIKDNPDGTQSIFNTKTGEVTGSPTNSITNGQMSNPFSNGSYSPNQTGIPLIDQNMKQTSNGVWYLDATNLTKAQQESISSEVANLGIPYMGVKNVAALQKISDVKDNMAAIQRSLDSLPSNAFTRPFVGPLNNLGAWTQSNPELASFNTWRTAAIGALQALAGGTGSGLRINQAEIQMSIKNDIPNIDDTVQTAQAKVNKINTMLDNQEKNMFGPQYDVQKAEGSSQNSTDALKKIGSIPYTNYAKQIQSIHNQFPEYTDDEILQIFNANIK